MICAGASGGVDGASAVGDVANGAGEVFSHTECKEKRDMHFDVTV